MWNPFKRKKKMKFDFDFQTFKNLFNHLQNEENPVVVLVDGQEGESEMTWYEFPSSYEDSDDDKKVLKERGFKNFYELLNVLHEKAGISPVDINRDLEVNEQYNLMIFNYYVPPTGEEKSFFKSIKCSFYLFFVCENEAEEVNAFRIFYSKGLDYRISDLLDAQFLVDINNPELQDEFYIAELEKLVAALATKTEVEINSEILKKHPKALLSSEVSKKDFLEALDYLNFWKLADVEEKAQKFYEQWTKDWSELFEEDTYYDDAYFPLRFEFFNDDNTWHSDWKFDPEDLEDIVAHILNEEDWTFQYPEETYSDDLFPYVQKALSERGFELMQMNTLGDSYQFFITRKQNVLPLLHISNKLKLGVEQLM